MYACQASRRPSHGLYAAFLLALVSVLGCQAEQKDAPSATPETRDAASSLAARADSVVAALKRTDWRTLATYVHPERGVRFSPYANVDTAHHVVLSRTQVASLTEDTTRYHWGRYDGTGDVIRLPFDDYYKRFIFDKDYAQAQRGEPNELVRTGNTISNLDAVYDGSSTRFIEYHVPGSERYDGMDWSSLRLVFERENSTWYLIGIVHDQWTI